MESTSIERPERSLARLLALTAIALFSLALAGAAAAEGRGIDLRKGAVFVMTNDAAGNQVLAYDRARDGSLSLQGAYSTGGGARAGSGSPRKGRSC